MRVQGELADRRKPELSAVAGELTSEKRRPSSKKNKRKQKKVGSTPSAVQRLFETCKEVFADGGAGLVPSPEDVDRLRSVLDNIDASDVGLTQNMSYFRDGASTRTLPITYLHIYECDKLSVPEDALSLHSRMISAKCFFCLTTSLFAVCNVQIGIFCLPPSAVIPLHNHPGMTVFSKLLFGSMHIKSYDWVNVPQNSSGIVNSLHFQPPGLHLAKVKTDSVFTAPCKTSVLYPEDGGNMHCFTARTSCAVLDVLGPPYSNPEDGRDCTYYNEFHYKSFSGDGNLAPEEDGVYAWLEEKKKPDDFFVVGAKYRGPKIIEQS